VANGSLFVISGPAGAGKSQIVKKLLEMHPDVGISVSCTTRKRRGMEQDGVDYHFIDDARFDELIAQGAFFEWARVHQDRYGTLKSVVAEELAKGRDLILEIDVQGCAQAMQNNPELVTCIFVSPPSAENIEKRLRDRRTESEDAIRIRLGNAAGEMQKAYRYDYLIIHQDWSVEPRALEIAAEEVYAIIRAKRLEVRRNVAFLDELVEALTKQGGAVL
jgi:guanylate kinase